MAVDWLLPAGCAVAVDVGAGTGLLTRALARRVPRVVAVEPDERMRAVLQDRSPGIEALAALSERFPGATEVDVPMRSLCWRADGARRR